MTKGSEKTDLWQQVKHHFNKVLDLPPEDWTNYLEKFCEDEELRTEVKSLLQAHQQAEEDDPFLEDTNIAAFFGLESDQGDLRIGPYLVIDEIGRGGMGTVYRATRDDDQYEREVALKIIRPGWDNEAFIRRFLSERQILASMEHPHIARLYDGGLTDDGKPYFAMEYADGLPIDKYCNSNRLTVRERLQLFIKVADAVAYAHSLLVVHRDLKPSNILVTESGDPKLLDFGVAKLLAEESALSAAPITQTNHRLMTPEYAAPEQVRGEAIGMATDVYALGILLYRLLTGLPPYRFQKRTPGEVERVICEERPTRPSAAAIRNDADENGSQQESRKLRSSPPALSRILKGDLDRIILKALRKEPDGRYSSAEALAEDIERNLDGRPVRARPLTWHYRIRKFVHRNRYQVAGAMVFVLLLVGYAATVTVQSDRIARERDLARSEAAKAEQVSTFLLNLFEANNPNEMKGDTLTARQLLARGVTRAEELGDQPEVHAAMLGVLGGVYQKLGDYHQADSLLKRALRERRAMYGNAHAEVGDALHQLGVSAYRQGQLSRSDSLIRRSLAVRRVALGEQSAGVAESLNDLAVVLRHRGALDSAEVNYRRALSIRRSLFGEDHPSVLSIANNLAVLAVERGDLEVADSMYRKVLVARRQLLGNENTRVANTINNLAVLMERKGELDSAERLHRQALHIRRKLLGDNHVQVAFSLNEIAGILRKKGEYQAAEPYYRQALDIRKTLFGKNHVSVGTSLNNLAGLMRDKGDLHAAESLYNQAMQRYRMHLGDNHPWVAVIKKNLGVVQMLRKDYTSAEKMLLDALAIQQTQLRAGDPSVVSTLRRLVELFDRLGNQARADRYREQLTNLRTSS